jgi:HPt (histidine-containing phosphotransfer) domain-containing protein
MKRIHAFEDFIDIFYGDDEAQASDDPLSLVPIGLRPLIPGFIERREREVSDLLEMMAHGDFTSIEEVAHKLKGNGAGYGFQRISDIGRELETAAKNRNSIRTKQSIEELEMIIANLKQVVQLRMSA